MSEFTVVFVDLTGSTGVFEKLGNIKAVQVITRLTHWIRNICQKHNGDVVKLLGDGVLILFKESKDAIIAAVELQKTHSSRIESWPLLLKMRLQIGMARGNVITQGGDCYGDAVNVASRLSDLSGSEQILVNENVIQQLPSNFNIRSSCLGGLLLRGRTEACMTYRVEWQEGELSEVFTMPARLMPAMAENDGIQTSSIELSWLKSYKKFTLSELPIFMGRDSSTQFLIQNTRVSRRHAMIDWRAGNFYLKDISSYGTWIRFSNEESIISLRRMECILLPNGEIALGASFEDITVPIVNFRIYI